MSWGYCCHNGPSTWFNIAEAAKGNHQSPIDIDTKNVKFDTELCGCPLKINYASSKPKDLLNTGSSIQMTFTHEGPALSKGPLSDEFAVAQFHFHWGSSSDHGSEHTVDGKKYAAELHIVHFNKSKYATISDAVNQPDGLCVLGMLIEVGKENEALKKVISSVDQIIYKNYAISLAGTNFDPSSLLPDNTTNYWTYPGSLTTPPCFESVTWILFEKPIEMSEDQMNKLRSMKTHEKGVAEPTDELAGKMVDNYRPPQPIHARTVRSSFKN